jgi:outer membrane usher protein
MRKCSPVLTAILLGVDAQASAVDYFDPSLLATEIGEESGIDLSIFSKPGGGVEGKYEVSIYINDAYYTRDVLFFKNGTSGALEPNFPDGFFDAILNAEYRLAVNSISVSTEEFIKAIPYSSVKYNQAKSRVDISLPQAYLSNKSHMKSEPDSWSYGIPAFLIDYRISGSNTNANYGETKNLYAYTALGLNINKWRLRSSANYTSYHTESLTKAKHKNEDYNFYSTYLERDIGKLRATLRVGELSTNALIHNSFNFIGGKIYSNDDMLNDRVRNYTPTIRGIAQSQAVVTVTQNDKVITQVNVSPGPFEINNFSLFGSSGDLYVRIKESNGEEHGFIQPFSTLPEMKSEGVTGFEVSIGQYDNSGRASHYNSTPFFYGGWSQGFNHGITIYGETLQSENYHLLGLGSTYSLGEFGAFSGDVSYSRANKNNETYIGQSYGFKYSKNQIDTGTTLTLATYRYSTKDFFSFTDFVEKRSDALYNWRDRLKNQVTLSLNQSFDNFGTLSLSASKQDYWMTDRVNKSMSASYGFSWNGMYFSTSLSFDQMKGYSASRRQNKTLGVYANIPLSVFLSEYDETKSSLSYNSTISDNRVRNTTSLTGKIPDTKIQYRVSRGWGNGQQTSNYAASLSWDGDLVTGSAGYTRSGSSKTFDYNVSGSSIFYPWGIAMAADSVIDGAAIVETKGITGVKVRQGKETSLFGTAVVTSLQPYTENRIDLDATGLPDNIVLGQESKSIVPEKGAILKLKYNVFKGKQVVFKLKRINGKPLPFGTLVSLINKDIDNTGIVDDLGRVYLAGIPEKGVLRASYGKNKTCEVSFSLESNEKDKPIVEYDGVCK